MPKRMAKLGQQLHTRRKARHLTLEQLSALAGVSKAMLSQIEQNKINPTVAIILKISDALNVGIAELIDEPSPQHILRVIHETDEHYTFCKDERCEIRTLSPLSLEKSIEFYRLRLEAGGSLRSESHFAGTEEFLHVARGKFLITSGKETQTAIKGDSVHYRADVTHCLENKAKGLAEAYLIVRYRETGA